MSEPFIFIATNRLKPGRLDDEHARVADLAPFLEANEPRLLAFNEYVDDAGLEVSVVQIHPDADSMMFHLGVVRERAAQAYGQTIEATRSIQIYGAPPNELLDALRHGAGEDTVIQVKPHLVGGFTRLR